MGKIIVKHIVLAKHPRIFTIEAKHQSHTQNIEVAQGGVVVGVLVLFEQQIVELAHQFAGLHRHRQFLLQMVGLGLHQKVEAVILLFQVFQFNHERLVLRVLHVINVECAEIASHNPPRTLAVRQLGGIALRLLERSERGAVALANGLQQVLAQSLLLNHHFGGVDKTIDETGVVEVHLVFKSDDVLWFLHAQHLREQGEPKSLTLPLLVTFTFPIFREFCSRLLL